MNIRRLVATAATALVVGGGLAVGTALPASAHTPSVSATCSAIDINLTNYEVKPESGTPTIEIANPDYVAEVPGVPAQGTPTILVPNPDYVPAIPEVPEVLGDPPLIKAEQLEVSHTENEYKQWVTGKLKWVKSDDWNPGFGWYATGNQRIVVDVPYSPAVYGPQPVITPYQPAVPAVGEPQIEVANPAYVPAVPAVPAVGEPTKTVENPDYVAADATPNTVTVIVDGEEVLDEEFGTSYSNSVAIDGTKNHSYKVEVVGYTGVGTKTFTGKTTACPPTPVVAPTLTVLPPTCDADGSLPFLGNPAAQNPNGYEFPGQGYRVYLDKSFTGAGTYVATIQKVGPGFDPAFPYGTKVSGETKQTLIVLPATGYQGTDPEAPCYVPVPENTREDGEWSTPIITCENEVGDEITITREVTFTEHTLNTETGKVETTTEVVNENDVYIVTEADIAELDCPVVTPEEPETPSEEPETPTETPNAPTEGNGTTLRAATTQNDAETLAQTGADSPLPWVLGGTSLALGGLALWLFGIYRRNQGGVVRSGNPE
ncbi:DnaE-like DNA polymerase III alpha [Microbacterium phage Potty]|nr:DnaE-like DNA polymerase III alpha [Microbacterium phage Potty]